jgi:hypothetical protein
LWKLIRKLLSLVDFLSLYSQIPFMDFGFSMLSKCFFDNFINRVIFAWGKKTTAFYSRRLKSTRSSFISVFFMWSRTTFGYWSSKIINILLYICCSFWISYDSSTLMHWVSRIYLSLNLLNVRFNCLNHRRFFSKKIDCYI